MMKMIIDDDVHYSNVNLLPPNIPMVAEWDSFGSERLIKIVYIGTAVRSSMKWKLVGYCCV